MAIDPDAFARLLGILDAAPPTPTTPDDYDIEERAGIMEFDGEMPRAEAERLAGIVPAAPERMDDATQPPSARPGASTGRESASICCRDCQHFTPDAINPAEGLGRCSMTSNGLPPPGGRGYGACLPHAPRSCPVYRGAQS